MLCVCARDRHVLFKEMRFQFQKLSLPDAAWLQARARGQLHRLRGLRLALVEITITNLHGLRGLRLALVENLGADQSGGQRGPRLALHRSRYI